ncbi:hypothetical protein SDRG_14581 [Saprolegnia diclina VS20]|uniref:Uncharacterized protein n=1 Tax=Saprolegnia diclina (strain VS20) TaxID=1156394 RepID=T0R6H0_SAPDV|nr:hypothetical protein SDRG_14581 [Saprolegnia diclina VS20]EQC27673.1 hypothetical protein SDRG_14581 [Saprolegnia diclina VS20]|eukprot:XP_008618941.1 hypothetical protein SDRG_14581 [Saprolegnia diclina VS20]
MRIQPTTGSLDPSPSRWRLPGALWLCATLAGTFYYLLHIQPQLANDFFWPHYNSSGYQTFLIDALNQLLETSDDEATVDLGSVMLDARYDGLLTTAIAHPTYAMALLTTKLPSLDFAITSLRNTSIDMVLWLPTPYCWVDFNKSFELAHTEARQDRCRHQYGTNGAVYLEAVARNIDWTAFLVGYGGPETLFWSAILSGLEASTRGVHWLDTVAATTTSVPDEVAFWQRHGIQRFCYQWQNLRLPGLVETATLVNALGPGSSSHFYEPLAMDLYPTTMCNLSLIRDTPNYILNTTCFGMPPQSFDDYSCL